MKKENKFISINLLLDTYGSLLTKKQQDIMKDKYSFDLSLQEISEHYNISRSAALDAIKIATNKLKDYESKLKLIKKKEEVLNIIKDKKIKEKIKEIL